MEQLSIRDWMILIGGMMIAAVLIDAVRRYWRERRAEIKLNARIERASALSDDDDVFNLLTELPNGGARMAQRVETGNTESEAGTPAQTTPSSDNSEQREPEAVESATNAVTNSPAADPPAPEADAEGSKETVSAVRTVAREAVAESLAEQQEETPSRRRTVKPAPDTAEPETAEEEPTEDADASGTVDWLDTLQPAEPLEPDGPEHGRLPRGANTHVFILYVVAQAEEGFSGTDILETLLACDLRFGDMDFFHRHERASGRGPIEFSVANMMKPGVFDIDNMEPLQTRGLMFFVTLPGPADMLKAFDYMYETVKVVAKSLGGDIQDETRSVITRQSLEHMRQQIRELERRLLVRRN
jgi:cell division protein ZipA